MDGADSGCVVCERSDTSGCELVSLLPSLRNPCHMSLIRMGVFCTRPGWIALDIKSLEIEGCIRRFQKCRGDNISDGYISIVLMSIADH